MQSESLVFFNSSGPVDPWRDALADLVPDLAVRSSEEITRVEDVRYALVWDPPHGFFDRYPGLRLITILGAGADAFAGRTDLPAVPVARISDPGMARMMSHYVLFAVLRYARDIPLLEAAQRERRWNYVQPRPAATVTVGILGLGELGSLAASELARQGFAVRGWSRSPKAIEGVTSMTGAAGLDGVLATSDIVVAMLPLTADTRRLLDRRRLALMRRGAKLINVSRGAVLDEAALVDALGSGHLGGATLDVFEREPLDPEHPLWTLPNVLITPHLASTAMPASSARQIAENISRSRQGLPLLNRLDLQRGY